MHVTDCKRDAMLAIVGGTNDNIDDLESLYLQTYGATSEHVNNQWFEVFHLNGATSANWNDAAQEFLLGFGAPFTNLADNWKWWWCVAGGAIGPVVTIALTTGDSCTFEPPTTTECTAVGTYTANDFSFTNPADTWLWSIEPPVVGLVLTDATANPCTVTTADASVDIPFNLKVIATDSVSTDTADRTTAFDQTHTDGNIAPEYIGPNIDQQYVVFGEALNPIDTFNLFTGTNLVFTLEGTWPADLVIDSGTGIITGIATDPVADYPNLTIRATNSKGFDETTPFTVTVLLDAVAPVWDVVTPQVWQEGVVIAQFAMSGFVTGTLPIDYTISAGALPVGITMALSGQLNGTPTVDGTYR
jgi:hypothetical protein